MYYNIDDKTRFVVIYQDVTQSVPSIVHYTGIHERTIFQWISKLQNGEDIFDVKKGRGRKKALEEEDLGQIEEEVKENPHRASSRQLALEYETTRTTITSALHELGFKYKPIHPIPQLTKEHKRLRVEFCQKLKEEPSQLSRIWFSDEMGYNLQEARKKVWTQEDYFPDERPMTQRLSVWAAISAFGFTSLEIFQENLNSDLYLQILDRHFYEMDRVNWRRYAFQHDNHSAYNQLRVKEWFKSKSIRVIDWPPNSPDLNPIENLWGWLKQKVKKDNPQSIEELEASLKKNWGKITVAFLQNFIDSLHTGIELCIKNQGERLQY